MRRGSRCVGAVRVMKRLTAAALKSNLHTRTQTATPLITMNHQMPESFATAQQRERQAMGHPRAKSLYSSRDSN